MEHIEDPSHIALHVFHILNVSVSGFSLIPLALVAYLILTEPVIRDRIGSVVLFQTSVPVIIYSICTLTMSILWLQEESITLSVAAQQRLGFFVNLAIIVFPFSIAMRYGYYFWVVVLEKRIIEWRWWAVIIIFWSTTIILSLPVALTNGFTQRMSFFQCTVPYYSREPLLIANSIFYVFVMISGGIIHLYFATVILRKYKFLIQSSSGSTPSQPNIQNYPSIPLSDLERGNVKRIELSSTQVSERQIIKKFIPITITYVLTHIPFVTLVFFELISNKPSNIIFQCIYAFLYTLSTVVVPYLILKANRKLKERAKRIFRF